MLMKYVIDSFNISALSTLSAPDYGDRCFWVSNSFHYSRLGPIINYCFNSISMHRAAAGGLILCWHGSEDAERGTLLLLLRSYHSREGHVQEEF